MVRAGRIFFIDARRFGYTRSQVLQGDKTRPSSPNRGTEECEREEPDPTLVTNGLELGAGHRVRGLGRQTVVSGLARFHATTQLKLIVDSFQPMRSFLMVKQRRPCSFGFTRIPRYVRDTSSKQKSRGLSHVRHQPSGWTLICRVLGDWEGTLGLSGVFRITGFACYCVRRWLTSTGFNSHVHP